MAHAVEMNDTRRALFQCFQDGHDDNHNDGSNHNNKNGGRHAALHAFCSQWYHDHLDAQLHDLCATATGNAEALGLLRAMDHGALSLSLRTLLDALSESQDTSLDALLGHITRRPALTTTTTATTTAAAIATAASSWMAGFTPDSPSSSSSSPTATSVAGHHPQFQLVFVFLGWLSMLYEPALASEPGTLKMVLPSSSGRMSRFPKHRTLSTAAATSTSSLASGLPRLPFPHLFASFGRHVPEQRQPADAPDPLSFAAAAQGGGGGGGGGASGDTLVTTLVHYANLSRVGNLAIHWVSDMSQHLDLDERNRSLRLFASPSFCALICLSDPQSTYPLNRLIATSYLDDGVGPNELDRPFDEYCREVLITYGLIFGQDKRSRRMAVKNNSREQWRRAFGRDHLLRQLCSEPWVENVLYDYLASPSVRVNYSLAHEFPFLGRKLSALQAYMSLQSPSDLAGVLFDMRDPLRFWTFVAAIGLGSVALLLGILQTFLAATQVALASPSVIE